MVVLQGCREASRSKLAQIGTICVVLARHFLVLFRNQVAKQTQVFVREKLKKYVIRLEEFSKEKVDRRRTKVP